MRPTSLPFLYLSLVAGHGVTIGLCIWTDNHTQPLTTQAAAHATTEKAQQKYIKLSKEADKLQQEVDSASKNSQVKEIEKLRTKSKKARQSAESADAAYKVSRLWHRDT